VGQALYRKYRSKSLSEIVGQEHVTRTLANAIKAGKISHAYLFTGPRGVGKTSIARILAHEVNGLPYTDESIHLDIIEIDAASNRRIDEIRDLRDKVHIAPTSAKYKVYIIDEVHMLTKEAFNALLKTLEEPPAHVIFILATTEAHKLPDTIVSRTQRFTFKSIDRSAAVSHLRKIAETEGMDVSDDALELLAEHGGGSFRDAISLLDQIGNSKKKISRSDVETLIGIAPKAAVIQLIEATLSGSPADIVNGLDHMTEQGIAPTQIAKQLGSELRSRLLEGQVMVSGTVITTLLTELLAVAASPDPGAALEIALFGANLNTGGNQTPKSVEAKPAQPKAPKNETKPKPAPVEVAPKPSINEAVATQAQAIVSKLVETSEDISSWWPKIVTNIKQHNNTIYGVLRMAHPRFDGTTLQLGFAFGLHAKKIADPITSSKLHETIQQLTGKDVTIEAVHDTALKGVEPSFQAPAQPEAAGSHEAIKTALQPASEDLGAVTAIFGGGEVLES
jgi:DNA polymerase-3 subunit gamma/tau